ncbi:MAG TPA: DUF6249 domain-containing protein [Flavitalea sp.]|nr:DUF6249 domain-containing protein [Flavitalea sp.]
MNGELLIPILVPLGFFALIFGIVYMNKKENLAMIDKGMNPKQGATRGPEPFRNLKWGLLLVGAGVGLFLAYLFDEYFSRHGDNEALYFALIAIGGGTGLIISYRMEMRELKERNGTIIRGVPSEL